MLIIWRRWRSDVDNFARNLGFRGRDVALRKSLEIERMLGTTCNVNTLTMTNYRIETADYRTYVCTLRTFPFPQVPDDRSTGHSQIPTTCRTAVRGFPTRQICGKILVSRDMYCMWGTQVDKN